MNSQQIRIQKSVYSTVDDVIKRLRKVNGGDRYSLLMEHMESLIFDWEEQEVDWCIYQEVTK